MDISIEYAQWQLSDHIQKALMHFFCKSKNKKCKYEVKNILERLLLCLVQKNNNNNNDTKQDDWSTVFHTITMNNRCVKKMISEFHEKKKVLNIPDYKTSDSKKVDSLVKKIVVETINEFLINKPTPLKSVPKVKYTSNTITFKNLTVEVTPKILEVLRKHDDKHVIPMICRYSAILANSQQWGLPLEQYNYMYSDYGIRYEGFASPLNSRLMGKPGAKFCSVFPDTDAPFGSIGSFFGAKMYLNNVDKFHWTVNPPYTEDLLLLSAQKCVKSIEDAKRDGAKMMFFYIMPGWFDSEGYEILHNSPHKKHEEVLDARKHFYEYKGKNITAVFKSIIFVFDSYDTGLDYAKICDKFKI